MKLLSCNAGSTSLKLRLYQMPEELELFEIKIAKIGSHRATYSVSDHTGLEHTECSIPGFLQGAQLALSMMLERGVLISPDELGVIAFKTVHGGSITDPCIIDESVLGVIDEYITVAPLHNRIYADLIRAFKTVMPGATMIAVFETGFHKNIPEYAARYGVPYEWKERYGIRKYGFHGASHSFVSTRVRQLMGVSDSETINVISCHLGGSSSLCAIKDGVSVDTTMGFSPQSGIVMGTRNGDLDVYTLFHLIEKGFTLEQLNRYLCHESGLKGISGIGDDFSELEQSANAGNQRARLALDIYCYDVKRYLGSYLAILGRTDAIVFTGGIGENSCYVRECVLANMERLGICIDVSKNHANIPESVISTDDSMIKVFVIPTNEEVVIARQAVNFLQEKGL